MSRATKAELEALLAGACRERDMWEMFALREARGETIKGQGSYRNDRCRLDYVETKGGGIVRVMYSLGTLLGWHVASVSIYAWGDYRDRYKLLANAGGGSGDDWRATVEAMAKLVTQILDAKRGGTNESK